MKKQHKDRSYYLFDNKALIRLILPLLCEQLLAILVGMADSIMIAQVGEAAVSGVSLVDQIMVLLINGFAALTTGGAVVTGQYLGRKDEENACRSVTQMVWFITMCACVITVVLYAGKYVILHGVFGKIDADVMQHANTYLMIVGASIPFLALYNCGAATFRAMGNSVVSMTVSVIMNLINVVGNALLIFGLHFGTEGVAIPTLVSRMVAAAIMTVLLLDQNRVLHMKKSIHFRFNWGMIRKILSVGIPNGLENSMFQLGKIIVLSLVSTFGTYAIAANAVSNVLAIFQVIPGLAISLAVTSVVSQCVGAGDYEQVKYYNKKLLLLSYVCMTVVSLVIIALLPFIVDLYNLTQITAQTTTQIIYFHGICCILIWPLSFILPATYRAAGDAKSCMMISIISMWLFRIIASWIFGKYLGFGVFGVWIAMIVDWAFRAVCFVIKYFRGNWQRKALVS